MAKVYKGFDDVIVNDQISRPLIVKFNEVSNSTTLSALAVKGAYEIEVTSTTGFTSGKYIILFHPLSKNFSFHHQVGAPAGNVITLDTPLDYAYPSGTYVDTSITDMSVDGSTTPRVFGLRGTGIIPGVDLSMDVTKIELSCIATSAVDLSLFANIAALTKGLVLRKRDGDVRNFFNVKTNAEMDAIMDWEPRVATNPAQGVDGFTADLYFAGQANIGVAVRLGVGEDLEIINQDNLTGITSLMGVAKGHLVI